MRILPAPFSLTRLIQSMYLSTNSTLLSQAVTARNTTGPLCAFGCEIPAANSTAAASANLKLMCFMTPPLSPEEQRKSSFLLRRVLAGELRRGHALALFFRPFEP